MVGLGVLHRGPVSSALGLNAWDPVTAGASANARTVPTFEASRWSRSRWVIAAPNPLRGVAADAHAVSDLVRSIEARSCSSLTHTAAA